MRSEFAVHILNAEGITKAAEIANIFNHALGQLEGVIGFGGREMSIVRTKLEEAAFFAKKAMAVRPENQRDTVGSA